MTEHTFDLSAAALAEMVRDGFQPQFPSGSDEEIKKIQASGEPVPSAEMLDLRALLWSSIDNDTSRDLDQVEYVERVAKGIQVMIAIADVSAAVAKGSTLDLHAREQAQTVYTATRNFPMLPLELSTDLTSLNEDQDRMAMVTQFVVAADGTVSQPKIFRAIVRNKAQLAYSKIGPWLEGTAGPNGKVTAWPELQAQLRLQDEASQALHAERVRMGALEFHRIEADPVVMDGTVHEIRTSEHNRATSLIEEFMIAANETMALTLHAAGRSCIRRVVRSPERWSRIVDLAHKDGTELPAQPDSAALNAFLQARRAADPLRYPDLALAVIKLMGPGEYVLAKGTDLEQAGHFGLAALDYAHSTAPNRRFVDLVTQRIVKAMLAKEPAPYSDEELDAIAKHCMERESAARKVERAMLKRVAAVALAGSIGKRFHGVITGANDKGVYVRVFQPPVEGKVVQGGEGLDVGDTVDVTLLHTDPQHAFIDFGKA